MARIRIDRGIIKEKNGSLTLIGFNQAEKDLFENNFELFKQLYIEEKWYVLLETNKEHVRFVDKL